MLHLLRIATSSCKLWQNYFLQKCKHCKTARRPICCLRMRRRGAGVVAMRTNISKGKEYYMLTCLLAPSLSKVGVGGNIRGRTRGEPTRPTERVDGELAIARVRHFRLEGCTWWSLFLEQEVRAKTSRICCLAAQFRSRRLGGAQPHTFQICTSGYVYAIIEKWRTLCSKSAQRPFISISGGKRRTKKKGPTATAARPTGHYLLRQSCILSVGEYSLLYT